MIPGTVLASRYELVRPLGLGGMGQVWLGLDRVLGREVAVKTVDLTASSDPSAAERFRREGRAAAALAHEHVVTVFDSGTDGSTAFLVMQLLPGPAVAELLEGGEPLPIDRAVEIAEQTAAALAAIHSIGIVHRDIKPANLVFDASGRLKVVDFGIASVEGTSGQLTATSTIVGSAAYMAPEQADGGGRATPATDLYALGCVMTTLLTGRPPFGGEHPLALLQQHVHAPAPRVAERLAGVPKPLDALVARLLSKRPDDRGDAAGVRDELAAIRSALPRTPPAAAADATVPVAAAAVPLAAAASAVEAREPSTGRLAPAGPAAATALVPAPRRRIARRVAVALGALLALAALLLAVLPLLQRPSGDDALASQQPVAEDGAPAAVTPPSSSSEPPAAPREREPATGASAAPAAGEPAPAVAGEPATSASAPPATGEASPAPAEPTATATAPSESAPAEPAPEPAPSSLAGVREAIGGAVAAGGLDAAAGDELLGRVAVLEGVAADGLSAGLAELRSRVDALEADGAATPEAAAAIRAAIDEVTASAA
ncbi:hypothetical protein L332_09560 [Agrococcus pavilionensis RW1]|uniref:non-specific serine/threonine protein kinase n=1 Tax=Agrococcus pavilionensis RW1 TaxID=1330458 RepID=U1LRJ9_9MICO|nr:serine/threonine-protein kinase [Agrococcus pavilionensis]ERG64692.1 hypothetical protein L332_09560 [Agrococcus pavilionensis RW1]